MSEEKNEKYDPIVEAILKQYEAVSSGGTKKPAQSADGLKQYFNTYLADGIKTGSKTVRILPNPQGGSPFTTIFTHDVKIKSINPNTGEVTVSKTDKKLTCPKRNFGEPCPFCEAADELWKNYKASGSDEDRKLAGSMTAKEKHVCRVIDRDHEQDGVKFWRFNHDRRGQGTLDKLMAIFKKKGDLSNPKSGRDLELDLVRDHNGFVIINTILPNDSTALHEDAGVAKDWIEDSKTWGDVFKVKDYEYLEIVALGGIPAFDKDKNKWYDATPSDGETSKAGKSEEITMGTPKATKTSDVKSQPVGDGDLPF